MKKLNGVYKICPVCKKEFYVPKYRENTALYCSVKCLNSGKYIHIKKICINCGKEFMVSNSRIRRKYCSEKCEMEYFSKKSIKMNELRLKRKISTRNSRGLDSRYLRKITLELHNYKCDKCGYHKYLFNLDIHHIDMNPNNNEENNRAVLCSFCHKELHYIYKGDFKNFMNGDDNYAVIKRKKEYKKKYKRINK